MTPQEVIKTLEVAKAEVEWNYPMDYAVAIDEAIKAVEKQIPKKVEEKRWTTTDCECGYNFSKHHGDGYYSIPYERKTRYCPKCGQRLDWSEEE